MNVAVTKNTTLGELIQFGLAYPLVINVDVGGKTLGVFVFPDDEQGKLKELIKRITERFGVRNEMVCKGEAGV